MKYYIVTTKCGHVGKNKYIVVDFPVLAENGKDAARKAREIPRVKHHHKDAILNVREVSLEEYNQYEEKKNNDDYLKCSSRQEQNMIKNISERIIYECESKVKKEKSYDNIWVHKVCVRNYRKYMMLNRIGV